MNPEGTRGSSSTSFTKGSCPARRAGAGSADVVAGSSVLALTAGLTARAKAPLGAPCSTAITASDGLVPEHTRDQWGIFTCMGSLTISKIIKV